MKTYSSNLVLILTFALLSSELKAEAGFCDPLNIVQQVYKVTTTDATYPTLSNADATCINNYVNNIPLSYPCLTSNPAGSTNIYAIMDVDGNGMADGVSPSNITANDASLILSFLGAANDSERLSIFNDSMNAAKAIRERRACSRGGYSSSTCTSDQIAKDLYDFNRDGLVNSVDADCMQDMITTGGGPSFNSMHPNPLSGDCAQADDLMKTYNVINGKGFNGVSTPNDKLYLVQYINKSISSYGLPLVKRMTDHYGCAQSPIASVDLAITLVPNTTTYNINVNQNVRIAMVPSGGAPTGNYTASFAANPFHNGTMSIDISDPTYQYVFDFTPTSAGTWTVDLSTSDGITTASEQVTFNVSNPVPTGSAPAFGFATPWWGWKIFAYATGTGGSSYSVAGTDSDGGGTVTLSTRKVGDHAQSGLPSGNYVSQQAFNPGQPNKFRGDLNFNRHPSSVGHYEFELLATDTGGHVTVVPLSYTSAPWFENIRNPMAADAPVSLSLFSEGSYMGEDVPYTITEGETVQLSFELPPPPFEGTPDERPWSHSLTTSNIWASPCPSTPGASYEAHPTRANTGLLTFEPPSSGEFIVCVRSSVDTMSSSKLIWGKTEHRLRFTVNSSAAPPPPPSLTMSTLPAQTTFSVESGNTVSLELVPADGVPFLVDPKYLFGYENISQPGNMNATSAFVIDKYLLTFTPQTVGTHTVDVFVEDSVGQKTSQTITINSLAPVTVGSAPEFTSSTPAEGQRLYMYAMRDFLHPAFGGGINLSFSGTDADGGNTVSVNVIDSPMVAMDWPQDGSSVSVFTNCNSTPDKFCGQMEYARDPDAVGTYNVTVEAVDIDGNKDQINYQYILEPFTETVKNVTDGNSQVTLDPFAEGAFFGEDVVGTFTQNEEFILQFELPPGHEGFEWVYTQPANAVGYPCDNPAGVVYEQVSGNNNIARLTYTPTTAGVHEICIQAMVHKVDSERYINSIVQHRLRFNVQPAASNLALNLDPNQTTFNATINLPMTIKLSAIGGSPGYTYGFENVTPATTIMYMSSSDRFYFKPSAYGSFEVDLFVIDSLGEKATKTITINVSNLQIAFQNPVDPANPVNWQKTNEVYWNNLIVTGGVGAVTDYTFVVNSLMAETAGSHVAGVSFSGGQPVFKFQPDPNSNYAINGGGFQFEIIVNDTAGNSKSTEITFNVTDNLQCADGFYKATPNLCCQNNEILDPTQTFCVNSMATMALVDKQDFYSEKGSANFPSLCKVETPAQMIGVTHNLGNSLSFSLDPLASQAFGANCRYLANMYKNYDVYAQGGDLTLGLTLLNQAEFIETQLDVGLPQYSPGNSSSNTNNSGDPNCDPNIHPNCNVVDITSDETLPTYMCDFDASTAYGGN